MPDEKFEVTEHCIMTAVYLNGAWNRTIYTNGFTIGRTYKGTRTYCERTKRMPWTVINDNGHERSVDHLGDGAGHLTDYTGTAGRFIIQVMTEHSAKALTS